MKFVQNSLSLPKYCVFDPSPLVCFCKLKEKTKYIAAKMKNSAHDMTHFSLSYVNLLFNYILKKKHFSSVSIW